ncbi:MAG: efflux RND transporter periplasmic adaptor subunit, partial [Planctomycetota bacterium]|jgi:RND family efflux transporter MFP subunit
MSGTEGSIRRRVIVSLVLAVVFIAAGFQIFRMLAAGRKEPETADTVARPIVVRTTAAARTTYRETLTGYGRARALRQTSVAAELIGIVRWISPRLEAGATVQEGEALVKLDERDLRHAVSSAEARLERTAAERRQLQSDRDVALKKLDLARRELAASRRELERIESLTGQNAATQSDYDRQTMQTTLRESATLELEGRLAALVAQIARNGADKKDLAATLDKARLDLSRAVIAAPYSGRVDARHVQPGARVAPGTTLFDLVDLGRIEIPVALPASRQGHVAQGAPTVIRAESGGPLLWEGSVARVAPTVRSLDRTFFVYLVLENPAGRSPVAPGTFVVAEVAGRTFEGVFILPRTAFVGERVFVVEKGVARARRPEVVAEFPHVLLATGGIDEGARVVLTNLEEVADGTKVAAAPDRKTDRDS